MNQRHKIAMIRLAVASLAAAVTVAVTVPATGDWGVGLTLGWVVASSLVLTTIWLTIGRMDSVETAAHAKAEDFDRPSADIVLLTASVASLVAVAFTLVEASHRHGWAQAMLIALTLLAVALAWGTVHTIYTLRYCDTYYEPPVGGIDFSGDAPDYGDFAYLAFTIGMTYQVSDTSVGSKDLRGTVLKHALLSYLFGVVIVAILINAVASLLR